ncbi:MAG TPA: 2OG-Fe(II) oxygenase [Acidimicrobiia bacterium]|nr:2OG-Fe(II) oxygenase [Acidimicrobiia bacterium]
MQDLVDLDWSIVDECRAQMRKVGACEIPNFVRAESLGTFIADARALAPSAHRSSGPGTVYLGFPDESFPPDHPQQWLGDYGVGAVAYDLFPTDSPIRRVYLWDELRAFVAATLGLDEIFPYADPLGALNLAVMGDGDQLQWHFDQTDFVVSLALQDADEGGDFEVAPQIRSADDERYDAVARVLAGDRSDVVTLPMTPGTLLIFAGRYSLHRVSPIEGDTQRLVALFGYDTKPGTMSSELLKAVRYGRVT